MARALACCIGLLIVASGNPVLSQTTDERGVLVEMWMPISGDAVSDLTGHASFKKIATRAIQLKNFDAELLGDSFGARYSALLTPPASGQYTFWIASDDGSELWLSSNSEPSKAKKIAEVSPYVKPQSWDSKPSQKSATVTLSKGKQYYLKALHKEVSGVDHLAVAWQGPGLKRQVISGDYLSLPKMNAKTKAVLEKGKAIERTMAALPETRPEQLPAFLAGLSAVEHKALADALPRLVARLSKAKRSAEDLALRADYVKVISRITPSEQKPIASPVIKALLFLEDSYLSSLSIKEVEALGPHRASAAFGPIPASADRSTKTVVLSSNANKNASELVSTGLYAVPGKPIVVTTPRKLLAAKLAVVIGHHNVVPASDAKRPLVSMPNARRSFTLEAASTKAISPHGGLIFINVPKEAGFDNASFKIDGAIDAPRFVLGQTTDAEWKELRKALAPWGELVAEHIVIVAPGNDLRALDKPRDVIEWWNEATRRHEYFYNYKRGAPFRMHVTHHARQGVSYWPLEWSIANAPKILDVVMLRAYNNGLFLHEHGHHADDSRMFFGNIGESTPNWAGYYLKGTGDDFAWKDTEDAHLRTLFDGSDPKIDSMAEHGWWTTKYTHYWSYPVTSMMIGYVHEFGWEAFRSVVHRFTDGADPVNVNPLFVKDAASNDKAVRDRARIDKWLVFLCEEAKHDVRPYFAHFSLKPSEKAGAMIDKMDLPRWDLIYWEPVTAITAHGEAMSQPAPTDIVMTRSGKLKCEWKSGGFELTNQYGNTRVGALTVTSVPENKHPRLATGLVRSVGHGQWRRVQFGRAYRDPIIVTSAAPSEGGAAPKGVTSIIRVRNLKSTGCELSVAQTAGDPDSTKRNVSWAVIEAGDYKKTESGMRAVAMKIDVVAENLSGAMNGKLLDYSDELSMLRAGRFGQVLTLNDSAWSSFYWQTPASTPGYVVGSHCGVDATPRKRETLGVVLIEPGVYRIGEQTIRVTPTAIICGDARVEMASAGAKQLVRPYKALLSVRQRHGASAQIVGSWPREIKPKTKMSDITIALNNNITQAGRYEVVFESAATARCPLATESVALLKDGSEVARDAHIGEAGPLLDRANVYSLDVKSVNAAAKYELRVRIRSGNPTAASGAVVLRRKS